MQEIHGIFIATGIHGRGVFTSETIPKNSPIEICPVIEIPENEVAIIHETELHDYYFIWGENDEKAAIALGYGSLYNHSYKPNADFILDLANNTINFFSIQKIKSGEEITINYHGLPESKDELWFDQNGNRIKRIKYEK